MIVWTEANVITELALAKMSTPENFANTKPVLFLVMATGFAKMVPVFVTKGTLGRTALSAT